MILVKAGKKSLQGRGGHALSELESGWKGSRT